MKIKLTGTISLYVELGETNSFKIKSYAIKHKNIYILGKLKEK